MQNTEFQDEVARIRFEYDAARTVVKVCGRVMVETIGFPKIFRLKKRNGI